jgi:hypothetical protein
VSRIWPGVEYQSYRGLSQLFNGYWHALNPTNKSKLWSLKVVGDLLEISVWTEGNDLVTSEFGLHQSEIEGNSKYQSRKGFHKLCKEGQNAGLWCRTKKLWGSGVGRILKIWLRIGIDFFKFLFVFKISFLMQYECMMPCNMSALYVSHQKKKLAIYRWCTYSRWQSRTHHYS